MRDIFQISKCKGFNYKLSMKLSCFLNADFAAQGKSSVIV